MASWAPRSIRGWAYDPAAPERPVTIRLIVDGGPAAALVCDRFRKPDPADEVPHNQAGFKGELPLSFWDGARHHLALADEGGATLFEQEMMSPRVIVAGAPGPTYGALSEIGARGVTGWVTDGGQDLVAELEVDGELIGAVTADGLLPEELFTGMPATGLSRGAFSFQLPAQFYDGSDHVISLSVVAADGNRYPVQRRRLPLPKQEEPKILGEVGLLAESRLSGRATLEGAVETVLELSLLADGVEVATAVSDPAADGAFAFDLDGYTAAELIEAAFETVVFPQGTLLPMRGEHPVRDSLHAFLGPQSDEDGAVIRIEAGLPLSEALRYVLKSGDDELATGAIAPDQADPLKARIALGSAADRADLVLTLGGRSFPIRPRGSAPEPEAPRVASASRPRPEIGAVVAPADERVRHRLGEVARGAAPDPDDGPVDISGVWRLTRDEVIEGWALDLTTGAPLEVELMIDGEAKASQIASIRVPAREARVLFEAPIGFRFPLSRVPLPAGKHQVLARVAGGGALLPERPRTIDVTEERRDDRLLDRIDALIGEGELFAARLLARAAGRTVGGLKDRMLLLDFATRAEWHDYPAWLQANREGADSELIGLLGELGIAPEPAIAGRLPRVAQTLGLPHGYALTVQASLDPTAAEFGERLAFGVALRALPPGARGHFAHDELAIACNFPRERASATMLSQLALLEEEGCHVSWHALGTAGDVAAEVRRNSDGEPDVVVVLGAPRFIGVAAAGLWPSLVASARPLATVATISGEPTPASERELAGRQIDLDVFVSAKSAPTDDAVAECLTWRLHEELEASGSPTCLLLHATERTPAHIPAGARLTAIPVSSDAGEMIEAAWAAIRSAAETLAPETPVMLLLPDRAYPVAYVETCLREFTLAGGASVVSCAILFDAEEGFVQPDEAPVETYLGLLAHGCYRLHEVAACAPRGLSGRTPLVLADARPFRVLTGLHAERAPDLILTIRRELGQLKGLEDRQTGFESLARMRAAQAGLIGDGARNLLSERTARALLLRLHPSPFPHEAVAELVRLGRFDDAADVLLDWLCHNAPIRKIGEAELRGLLDAAKLLSLHDEVVDRIGAEIPSLGAAHPPLLIPLFELLATSRGPAEVGAAVMACAHFVMSARTARPLYRIVDLCRRFCSAHTMVMLLQMIDASPHARMLQSDDLARMIGESLTGGDQIAFALQTVGFGPDYFRGRAPLVLQIAEAIRTQDRAATIRLVNAFLATRTEPMRLVGAIRTYSWELSQFAFRPGEIVYPRSIAHDQHLTLAIVLGDMAAVAALAGAGEQALPSPDGSPEIVAATYLGDFGPLDRWFADMGADCGAKPIKFAGGSIEEMYRSFAEQAPAAADQPAEGRVSVLLTVFNPELPLLDLSITSILQQTHRDLEIILVDDASDVVPADDIARLAERDPRISFLRMNRNSGPYVCRNRGLEVATGDYVAIQDDDDFSHPQRFEVQLRALGAGGGDMLKLCTTSHLRIDQGARLQFEHSFGILGDGTMTSMFRRDVFDRLGMFAGVRSRGDVEFRERIKAALGQHVYVHLTCPTVFCYARPSSLSNTTARTLPGYLALWRDNFGKKAQLPLTLSGAADGRVIRTKVPLPLRSDG